MKPTYPKAEPPMDVTAESPADIAQRWNQRESAALLN
jgi:hypothetical protein